MKRLTKIVLSFMALVGLLIGLLMVRGGTLIRETINSAGPKVLGVPVRVQDVSFHPLSGRVRLEGLQVGNPEGYKTEGVFALGLVEVVLETSSLLSDTLVIRSIDIVRPQITYERGLKDSNIGSLLNQLGSDTKSGAPSSEPARTNTSGGRKVIIRELNVTEAQVKVSVTALQGLAAPIPLPPVKLTGIGEETGGTSIPQALGKILKAILGAVTDLVVGTGKLVGEGLSTAGGAALDGTKAVGGAAVGGVKAIGNAAGTLTEGAGNLLKRKEAGETSP